MRNRSPARGQRVTTWACLVLLVAACGPPSPAPTPPQNNQTEAALPTALATAGGIEFMVSGSGPQLAAYRSLVSLYQQRYPGQTVNLVGVPGKADFQRRLAADIAAGTLADVIAVSYTNVPGLASRGQLAPAASYLAGSQVLKLDDFTSAAVSPFIFERQLQCVPFSVSGLAVYYNKDLFQRAGLALPGNRWTRQEFVADAQALTLDTNGDDHPDQYGLGIEPSLIELAPFVWQLKGQLVDVPAWPTEMEMSAPIVVSATTWLVGLQTRNHVVPNQEDELAASSDQRFQDGRLAMIIGTRASVPSYRQITAFDWDVAPLPANGTGTTNVIVADGLCLSATSHDKSAAWQFIEFAASADGQALMAREGAIVPAQTSVAHSPDFLDAAARPKHSQVFLDALDHSRALPKLENWTDIQAIIDEELQQAFYGHKDILPALEAATTRSEEYLKIHIDH